MDVTIREIQKHEYPLLNHFLYEAIFVPEGVEPPPKTIIKSPELQVYVTHFGKAKDDWGLAAEVGGQIVGAVWVRIMNDYGHIDKETPSLAISLYKEYRSFGLGTAMMKEMLALLKAHGYKQVSLSVQKANYAAKLALQYAFQITGAEAVQLNVFSENTPARHCYEKVGFVERNVDKNVFPFKDELWSRCNMIVSKQSFH